MKQQNFRNHPRFVPGFHFLTSALILTALVIAIILMVSNGISLLTVFSLLAAISLLLMFFFTRQFATGNQDRIIRLEESLRVLRLTGKLPDERLTRAQQIALRFADDSEYPALSEKAIEQNLSATDIKKAIQQWKADHHRI